MGNPPRLNRCLSEGGNVERVGEWRTIDSEELEESPARATQARSAGAGASRPWLNGRVLILLVVAAVLLVTGAAIWRW
jgi:hypothetical protein